MKYPEIKSLYKYRPLDTNSIQAIVNEVAWFSTPSSFNDPFDCGIHVDDRRVEEAIAHAVEVAYERTGIEPGKIPKKEYKSKPSDAEAFLNFRSALFNLFQTAGILSLSEISNDILMWAHYANSHEGFCIEYERTEANALGKQADPVEYQDELPSLKPEDVIHEGGNFDKLWLTKSSHWKYEREWRVLAPEGGKLYSFPCQIKSITFGLKMSNDNRLMLRKILEHRDIKFNEAVRDPYEFKVNVVAC